MGKKMSLSECIRLLEACCRYGVIRRDPMNQDNIIVVRTSGRYSECLVSVALELQNDTDGQMFLVNAVRQRRREKLTLKESRL